MNIITSNLRGEVPAEPVAIDAPRQGADIPLLRQYLRIALRWRYVILGSVAVCFILGLIITLLMTPKYTADSTLEISRESDQVTNFQGVQPEASVADQEFYQTQYGLLKSRSLSERVAVQLNFVDDPKFFDLFGVPKNKPAFQLVDGQYSASGRNVRQRAAGEILLRNVDIAPTRLSRLVDIRFTSPNAALSARVANAWAENFIQTNLERKIQATSYGRNLLQRQLSQLKQKLDESQRLLVDYASAEKIINLPAQSNPNGTTAERSIVADNLATLNAALSQATADRIQAEARYEQAGRAGSSPEALGNLAINDLRQKRADLAAQYQQLMTQFEPGYPAAKAIKSQIDQIDRSLSTEEGRVSNSLLANYRQAQVREQDLQTKVDQLKTSYLDLRRRSIQYNIYQQEVDTNKALYDGLLERFKQIGVSEGVGVNNVSIVDPADVPEKPSSPRLLVNLALALLAGLGIGAGLAF
ncbi:MAG: GumC family protein, partial [Sphingomonas sp.]